MERTKLADSSPPIARPYETIQLVPVEAEGAMIDAPFRPELAQPRGWSMRARLFVGLVLLPSFVVAVYLFLIAAHRYVSEANFIVRSAAYQGAMAAGSSQAAVLASSHGAGDLADAVNSYIKSRDMVEQLETTNDLRKILSREESDFLYRFPNLYRRDNREELYNHFGTMVSVEYDKTSGITAIAAVTFRPDDSQALVNALLGHAEELVNRLNERMVRDAEAYAQSVVNRAQEHLVDIGLRLVKFRNAAGSVDPSRESATALEQIAQMTTELAEMQASLQQQISLSPSSPAIAPLRERIRTYQEQIDREKMKIVGADRSLSGGLAEFEKLTLERQLAAREMDSALGNLTAARQDAQRQHLYLQRITQPNLADEAKYPRRFLMLAAAFGVFLAIFVVVNSILKGFREHSL
ncbi:hypothetical protein [Bradyrhizobium sp. Ec3.3]|uniref:hypothetical protein n=1 Tax=Bradyrhizobium sp. Ec3.3 TaxID=189753 RepID=UPI000401AE6B|nr:hypothetical protein [Bradyrhizobium sp. Ec3.3]